MKYYIDYGIYRATRFEMQRLPASLINYLFCYFEDSRLLSNLMVNFQPFLPVDNAEPFGAFHISVSVLLKRINSMCIVRQ